MVTFKVLDNELNAETSSDLFSPKGLDKGTELLLSVILSVSEESGQILRQKPQDDKEVKILDWGCGWGAISLVLAKQFTTAQITAIDSDIQAIKLTKQNAKLNNLNNIEVIPSHGFDQLKDQVLEGAKKTWSLSTFDLIASHPPTHRGREVVEEMIAQSFERLNQKGELYIVVEARLKPWVARHMKAIFKDCKIAKRSPKHVVLSAQK